MDCLVIPARRAMSVMRVPSMSMLRGTAKWVRRNSGNPRELMISSRFSSKSLEAATNSLPVFSWRHCPAIDRRSFLLWFAIFHYAALAASIPIPILRPGSTGAVRQLATRRSFM